ncbi:MAG: UDP-N-acetylglucosamine 1-carboxyvinyltransferase, partial [Phycisphaeraceae bacterium]|nr:UDP-N-acetylglucosamine 1-carboxyvinyltransferase [Phycisphaeraceae bacterium]
PSDEISGLVSGPVMCDNMAMDAFVIEGGHRLRGEVRINGSKNAALPLMAAALLTDQPVTLRDVPNLSDIRNLRRLLAALGCEGEIDEANGRRALTLEVTDTEPCLAHYDIVRTMRASICVLGPLLARRGEAKVSMPGGCNIGDRPVDLHLRGLRAMGAEIELDAGYIVARAPAGGRLKGTRIFLGGPFGSTVLGTANVMSAATLAEGTTIIESAACEPEIADLARLLTSMGAKIRGAGSPRIEIDGVSELGGTDHRVLADRIEAGTYILASAMTNGDVTLENTPVDCLGSLLDRLEGVGVQVEAVNGEDDPLRQTVRVVSDRRLKPVQITTQPYPGFPTDLQAQMMTLLCMADGNSIITEKIFPDRFLHVAELLRMGANLVRNGPNVMVMGVKELVGAPVMASDLRASAGLVMAGLAASGTTTVNRVYHLDRGYESMETRLASLGAKIKRTDEEAA